MPRMKLDYAPLGQQNYLTKRHYRSFATWSMGNYGTPDRIRTCDLSLRKAALYPAELRAHINY